MEYVLIFEDDEEEKKIILEASIECESQNDGSKFLVFKIL